MQEHICMGECKGREREREKEREREREIEMETFLCLLTLSRPLNSLLLYMHAMSKNLFHPLCPSVLCLSLSCLHILDNTKGLIAV